MANSEIRSLKEQLEKQGYSDVTIEEILRWYLGSARFSESSNKRLHFFKDVLCVHHGVAVRARHLISRAFLNPIENHGIL